MCIKAERPGFKRGQGLGNTHRPWHGVCVTETPQLHHAFFRKFLTENTHVLFYIMALHITAKSLILRQRASCFQSKAVRLKKKKKKNYTYTKASYIL